MTVEASCNGCAHERSDSYTAQSDSGFRVYCEHPAAPRRVDGRSYLGDTTWATPPWCPLLVAATERFGATLTPGLAAQLSLVTAERDAARAEVARLTPLPPREVLLGHEHAGEPSES